MNLSRDLMPISDAERVRPAGFWLRVFAFILDSFIFSALLGALIWGLFVSFSVAIYAYLEKQNFQKESLNDLGAMISPYGSILTNSNVIVLLLFSPLFLNLLYYSIFEASFLQATPGKLALGLVVTDPQDARPRFGAVFMRNVYKFLPQFLPVIGLMFIAFAVTMKMISIPLILIAGLGSVVAMLVLSFFMYASVGWTEFKQGLHDKWSYCYVQKKLDTPAIQRQGFALLAIALFCFSLFQGYSAGEQNEAFTLKLQDTFTVQPNTTKSKTPEKNSEMVMQMQKQMSESMKKFMQEKKQPAQSDAKSSSVVEQGIAEEFPSDSQEKSLQILKRGRDIAMGGIQNSNPGKVEERPVLQESASGFVRIGRTSFKILRAKAALREGRRVVEILHYGRKSTGEQVQEPLMKMYFSYKTNTGNCYERHLQNYVIKINAQYFGLTHVKKGEYLTFTRRGGDIQLNEKIQVSCQRHEDGGWVRFNGVSKEAALLYGVRYPVQWELNVEDSF